MAVEMQNQGATQQIAARPTINVRELVEKVAKERQAAAALPPEPAKAAESAPAAEPPKPAIDPQVAIDLERTRAEAAVMREKLDRMDAEIRRRDEVEQARKADWRKALGDYGYKPEDVLPAWLQDSEAKPSIQPDPQAGLVERLSKLEGVITNAERESVRERRMREVREAMGAEDGEDYAVMRTIGADQGFLDQVMALEQKRGVPVGNAELVHMLKKHEENARGVVKPQIERLAKSAWGRDLIKALLQEAAKTAEPKPAEELEDKPLHARESYGEPRPTIQLGRDMNRIIDDVKRRVAEKYAQR